MTDTIAKKTKIRGGHKAHLTKLLTSVTDVLKDFDLKKEVELLGYRDTLKRKAEILAQLDDEILMQTEDDDIDEMIEENEKIQSQIQAKITGIDIFLKKIHRFEDEKKAAEKTEPMRVSAAVSAAAPVAVPAATPKATIKLPKYEIKRFSGEATEYRAFWDAFQVAIDQNVSLSNVEKFTYLKSYVTGDAEDSIKGLTATDVNYKMAVDILKQRYGNTQVIVNSHMKSLTRLPSVHDDRDTKRIRKLYDKIESDLRSLKALGVKPDGLLLVPLLLEKFPEAMNLRLSRKFQSNTDVWNVDEMMEELRKELEARERCSFEKDRKPKADPTTIDALIARLKTEGYDVNHSSLDVLVGQQSPNVHSQSSKSQQRELVCPFCSGNHYADKCRTVTDVVKRKDLLKKQRRCFLCCSAAHVIKDCTSQKKCYVCNGAHHTSICDGRKKKNEKEDETKDVHSTPAVSSKSKILLQTAQLDVRAYRRGKPGLVANCKVLFDSGSQRTHITRELAEKIKAPIVRRDNVNINGFGGISLGPQTLEVAQLILTKKGYNVQLKIEGLIVEKICKPLQGRYVQSSVQSIPHIRDKKLADDDVGDEIQDVAILIGLDYYHDVINGEPIIVRGAPTLVSSIFGYVLSGDVNVESDHSKGLPVSALLNQHVSNEDLLESVKDFFSIESSGISEEDEIQQDEFDIGIEKRDDRYYVNYPFKSDHRRLCDNYRLSLKRFHGTCRRMKNDADLRAAYCDIMTDQEKNGIIENVPEDSADVSRTYYMPHHPVIRDDKTTSKYRIVYDCSSKEDGASLNECLQTGTCEFTDLLGVLVRFRYHTIGMTADIKQAFLQIGIKEDFRDLTRFLWLKDPTDMNNDIPRRMRFARLIFGGVSSMAILDNVNQYHLERYMKDYPITVQLIRDSLYCDDFDGGAKDDDSGFKVYSEVKAIFGEASMNMRKWITSSSKLNSRIKEAESRSQDESDHVPSYAAAQLNPDERAPVKVLGIPWNTNTDELSFTLNSLKDYPTGRITKRILLSGTTKPFDPLGILAPIILTLKILFQTTCVKGDSWDDQLPAKQQEIWDRFLEEAKQFNGLRVPRCYGDLSDGTVTLIGFGDASESAYAACIYLHYKSKEKVISTLVAAKTRVAPVKKITLPRLELLAALCLSKLMVKIQSSLQRLVQIQRIICLTDAEIVLNWITREDRSYKQFVRNRCMQIRDKVPVDNWYHVPGKVNAADLPSRGCFPRQLQQPTTRCQWLNGPEWMSKDEEVWPIRKDIKPVFDDPELKVSKSDDVDSLITIHSTKPNLEKIIKFEDYSCINRLIRVVAWCNRFISNCRIKKEERRLEELNAEEYDHAKILCIQSVQIVLYQESGHEKRCQSLGLYEDEQGIQRCRGRIGKAKIPFSTRFPILIPRNHHFTELIIRDAHEKVYHNGVKETLAELRSVYWIVKGRQIVKRSLRRCLLCKRIEGLAYPPPVTSDLPDFRVGASRAFDAVGVDFCGPIYVKDIYKPGSMHKAYIAINTCTSTRMLHLELTPDLTTAAYLRSHRRFIARRGCPSLMVSDNGKTFKGQELKKFNAMNGTKWRFNLSKAAWWGGVFERMVRSTKRCLKKAIGLRKLSYEELNTILIEIEAVINNRPLVYVEEEDMDQLLTPSHLFCGRRTMDKEFRLSHETEDELNPNNLISRTKQINASIDHFWRRWSKEYLIELRENHKMKNKQSNLEVRPGDAVFIHEDYVKRNKWHMGVIEKCIVGADGVTRGATVKKVDKDGKTSYINRPLQKLYPMELTCNSKLESNETTVTENESKLGTNEIEFDDDEINDVIKNSNKNSRSCTRQTRSKRGAAIDGEIRRRCNDYQNFENFDFLEN